MDNYVLFLVLLFKRYHCFWTVNEYIVSNKTKPIRSELESLELFIVLRCY